MKKGTVKFIGAIAVALVVMLAFRSLVMTVCTVDGKGLEPVFQAGDRVGVNRWSYGLRTGAKGSLFDYGRICRQEVKKGDFIAFEDSLGEVLICRCAGVPGDTIFDHGDRHHDLCDASITVPVPMIHDFREGINPKHPQPDPDFEPKPYYQVYQQKHGFLANLSVLDLLFNMGPESIFYL